MTGHTRRGIRRPERLKRRRLLGALFGGASSSVSSGCIRVVYRFVDSSQLPTGVRVQVAFSASRRLGNAVTRNRVKRQMRAAFPSVRSEWSELAARSGQSLTLMILHRGPVERSFDALLGDLSNCSRTAASRHDD